MTDNHLIEFDTAASIKAYNFTLTAIKNFYDTIDSDQFEEESGEKIFEYLNQVMELVSFKDYLKRQIYRMAKVKEPYTEFSGYLDIILERFEENGCLDPEDSKAKQKLKKKAKRWLESEYVKRESMFEIGFGLDMSEKDISHFLTLVLKEADFDFYNPEEVIYWHCRHTGKKYPEAVKLLEAYKSQEKDPSVRADHMWQAMQRGPKMYLATEEGLQKYLRYLKQLSIADERDSGARKVFDQLYVRAQKIAADYLNSYSDDEVSGKRRKDWLQPSEVNPAKIESILYNGVPVTKTGNLQAFAKLKKQFKSKRLTRARINEIQSGKPVERFDIITLIFFIYALDEEKLELNAGPRFHAFVEETNDLLMDAGMMDLYPVNPYEAFILMCIVSDDLLATFSEVWEKTYEE